MTCVDEADYTLVGDLFAAARREAEALRASAKATRDEHTRAARLRVAVLIDELIAYAVDRDRALALRVAERARLRARIERAKA